MEASGSQRCSMAIYMLAHGSELCIEEKCVICNHGRWEDMFDVYPIPPPVNPEEK